MTLTSRDKKIVIALVCVALVAAIWLLLLGPKRSQLAEVNKSVASQEKKLEAAKVELIASQQAKNNYASYFTEVVRLGEAVPEDDAVPSLLVQLDGLTRNKLDFSEIGVDQYPDTLLAPSKGQAAGGDVEAVPVSGSGGSKEATGSPPSSSQSSDAKSSGQAKTGSAQTVQTVGDLQPIALRLQFQGSFFLVDKLFADMQRMVSGSKAGLDVAGRLIFIQGFKFKGGRSGFPKVAANMGVFVFSLPQGQTVTDGATAATPTESVPVADTKQPSSAVGSK